jgi:hypothetical protein
MPHIIPQVINSQYIMTMMKKYIVLPFMLCASIFVQAQDYSKLKKEELIVVIGKKETEINNILDSVKKLRKPIEPKVLMAPAPNGKEASLKKIISETNQVFLQEIFENKYIKNSSYFQTTDLAADDNTERFRNSGTLINSLMAGDPEPEVLEKCDTAIVFNQNYLVLFDIRKNVLGQKYNETEVNQSIIRIDALPPLAKDFKLDSTKRMLKNLLANYLDNTCALRLKFEKYRPADQTTAATKKLYTALESDPHFKDYPYLIQVIRNIKANVNNYNPKEDLQPCKEPEPKAQIKPIN